MKTIYISFLTIITCLIMLNSCIFNNKNGISNVIASINGEKIFTEEIDQELKQEIYEKLYQIYIIRKMKLQEDISEKIILLESRKYNISADCLINSYLLPKVDMKKISSFAIQYNLDTVGISNQFFNNKMPNLRITDKQNPLLEKYKAFQLDKYLDSLKRLYNVKINIQPPRMPNDRLSNIIVHYKGNLDSPVTVLVISDLDCSNCRKAKPIYDSLYEKYNGKIKFGYSDYSREVRISALALESASSQNKFWEMYNTLYERNQIINMDLIAQIAQDNHIEMKKFISDMQDSLTYYKIYNNYKRINDAGFYVTPSMVINNKVISNPTSIEEIENVIEYELSISK